MYARPIEQLIRAFSKLPSVGQRTAERFVFSLLKSGKKDVAELTIALKKLIEEVRSCETCWDFADTNPCGICSGTNRDPSVICVVKESQDVQTVEKTKAFAGHYHVLRGTLTIDVPDEATRFIKVRELLARASNKDVKEIILALSPDLPGETTMMFLEKKLQTLRPDLTVSRLARGLPIGSDVQYADEITLTSALKHRTRSS